MKNRILLQVIPVIFSIITLSSCKHKTTQKPEIQEVVFSEEIAKHVSYITAGNIFPAQPLEIVFIDNQVSEDKVGSDADLSILKISPSTPGKLIWKSANVLNFIPEKNWKMRENYSGEVFLKNVSEDLSAVKDELKFYFYVEGQELQNFKGDLVLKERNSPKLLKYIGKLTVKMPATANEIKQSMVIKGGGKARNVIINDTGDGMTFTFETEDLPRTEKAVSYSVLIKKDILGLSENYEDEFQITPLQKMMVKKILSEETGRHPRIRVVFSDDIETSQDISGYFSVSPDIKPKVSMSGNTAIVDGNFKYGEAYDLKVSPGIQSRWATIMENSYSDKVKFSDLQPSIEFASDGIIMPTSNNSKLQFMSSNLSRVHIEVKKVFSNRIMDFVRQEEFSGGKQRHNGFTRNYGGQLGVILLNKTMEIGDVKNEWLLSEIDLSSILNNNSEGLYLIRLNFNPRDMMVDVDRDPIDYVADNGEIHKPVVISNLGITAKKENDYYQVFVTDLITTKPVSGAHVEIYRYWDDNSEDSDNTDSEGHATLSTEYGGSIITAEKDGQISYLKLEDMQWNTSGFDVEGVSSDYSNIKAYTFTERGVYRPGDPINLSMIIRNDDNTFPDNHPVILTLYNPDNQKVFETRNTSGKDGFYSFHLKTNESDPTGNWEARIDAGSRTFYHYLKIETVVPLKLKVRMDSDKDQLGTKDSQFSYRIVSSYLFGAPASGLSYDAEVEVFPRKVNFAKFSGFNFNNDFVNFNTYTRKITSGKLDSTGTANVSWVIPQFEQVPSALSARFINTVYEKGGRQNTNRKSIPIDNYQYYVGLEKPGYWYHYVTTNEESSLQVVCVDNKGESVEGRKIYYRIYQNSSYWWYHYDNRSEYQMRYKTDNNTTLVTEGSLISGKKPVNLKFLPREDGDYLIEVQEGGNEGHTVSQFVYAYAWGSVPSGDQNAGTLMMKADKPKYNVGDIAHIKFPAPEKCAILYSLERENDILEWKWLNNNAENGKDMEIDIPITANMVPNTYLTISVLQPHEQTMNDRPMRMFGILPILAEDKATRQGLDIQVANELEPNKDFNVTVQTKDQRPTQFTIAVVDEGLLDLTNFQTPNPWKEFFRKVRLNISTYDLFSQIIGANKGDIYKAFSIGGDMDDFREQQLNPEKGRRRFKPVCLFKGPVSTDNNGKAVVSFKMPEYNGSVRIMVVSAHDKAYGSADKTVPVRTDLMVEPAIPRILGPAESFVLPVSVFAMKDNVGKVTVNIKTEGPISVDGTATKEITFTKAIDKEVFFKVNTKKAAGQAKIVISAKSSKMSAVSNTDIMVRPSSPRQYTTDSRKVKPGESTVFTIPNDGLAGTNHAQLKIEKFPNMNFEHRLEWLIQYPYGCIEQTTSSVFPQLFLKSFIEDSRGKHKQIDENINAGIERLVRFQTSEGGMSYWPGGRDVSPWPSVYAAHFLVEAKSKGYHVPDYLYDNLLEYLERQSRYGNNDKFTRIYRAYVLSRTDKDVSSEINRINQDLSDELSYVQKVLLAAAYYNIGKTGTAEEIIAKTEASYDTYDDFTYHFGSRARDMGMVLNAFIDMDMNEDARLMAEEIAKIVSSRDWYSTHSIGYMLLSLGRFFDDIGMSGTGTKDISGYYLLDGNKIEFGPANNSSIELNKGFGKELKVFINQDSGVEVAYVDLNWNGVPLKDTREKVDERIQLNVEWLNENGQTIDPTLLSQTSTIYGHFEVRKNSPLSEISEVALVQILPSGWEIENLRLSGDQLPSWTSNYTLNREEYTDIRDDRMMWFFDLRSSKLDFVVKVNVVSQGNFYLPPTVCEAMYNNDYYAIEPGKDVRVVGMGR